MRRAGLEQTPTAILSRQTAGIRGRTQVIDLPGEPASIGRWLGAIFGAVPYCLDLIGGAHIDTGPAVVRGFRPK